MLRVVSRQRLIFEMARHTVYIGLLDLADGELSLVHSVASFQ